MAKGRRRRVTTMRWCSCAVNIKASGQATGNTTTYIHKHINIYIYTHTHIYKEVMTAPFGYPIKMCASEIIIATSYIALRIRSGERGLVSEVQRAKNNNSNRPY